MLHVSEIAEHRVKEVKDELREGDQILVKVLAIEGNRIKLSRKAVLREQRAKLGLPEAPEPQQGSGQTPQPAVPETASVADDEGNFDDEEDDADDSDSEDEPNFNRADDVQPVGVGQPGIAPRNVGGQGGAPGAGGGGNRRPGGGRRRRGGRRPGQGGGGNSGAPRT